MSKRAPTEQPVLDPIAQRWSPRAFAERAPSDEELAQILEAARWAPSCFNEQPWRYILVRAGEPAFADALACLAPANQSWAHAAPVLGFSLAVARFARNDKPNRHAWHDVGAATAMLSIEAASFGLMVHQMAGFEPDQVRERFAVPDGIEAVAALAIGWPGDPTALAEGHREKELAPRARKPLAELILRAPFIAKG